MKKIFIGIIISVILYGCQHKASNRVLVFTKTTRYHHESIPAGIKAIQQMGLKNNFEVDTTTDSHKFSDQNLLKYSAVIFLSTSGELLDPAQRNSFKNYISSGGGFVGIHSASASEKQWPWFGKLIGAVFTDHPEPQIGNITVLDKNDASVANIPSPWVRKDEWYNFKTVPTNVHLLLGVDEKSYKGSNNGTVHPLAWKHEFAGGKVFYTALGHFSEAYQDKLFVNHILEGIKYVMEKRTN